MTIHLISFASILHKQVSLRSSHEAILSEIEKYYTVKFVDYQDMDKLKSDDFKIISTHAPRTARKSIFKLWKMCYTVRMDRTTLIDFFEEVETTEEYNGYFCSIAEAAELWCWAVCAGSGT